jgi:hypothetical protein
MATNRDFGNMLKAKPATKGIQKKPKKSSPWLKMGKKDEPPGEKIAQERKVPRFQQRKKKRAFKPMDSARRAMGIRNSSY